MSEPKVWNIRDPNKPFDVVRCDRKTKFGNPFVMRKESERDLVCDRFEKEILPSLDVSELRGKDLACWCAPKRCHCDSILRKANS